MTVIFGKAVLELHPWHWRRGSDDREQAVRVLHALWGADDHMIATTIGRDGVVLVEVTVPTDGSLDLHALRERLQKLATSALT